MQEFFKGGGKALEYSLNFAEMLSTSPDWLSALFCPGLKCQTSLKTIRQNRALSGFSHNSKQRPGIKTVRISCCFCRFAVDIFSLKRIALSNRLDLFVSFSIKGKRK